MDELLDKKRFFVEKTERTGTMAMRGMDIIVDSHTGVQYLYSWWGNGGGGLTVLVDRDGKPLVSEDDRVWR